MGYQTLKVALPSITWAAGGNAVTLLKDLPKQAFGRLAHLAAITWEVDVDPTFTAAPTVLGLNSVVSQLAINDGRMDRFDGAGFNSLRFHEIMEHGSVIHPDPDTNSGSTNNFYFRRTWFAGPPLFAGGGSDFLLPCGALENGQIRYTFGALTDISADTTAATVTIRPYAHIVVLDDLRIPPAYERRQQTLNAADVSLQGRALYAYLTLFNSASWDAIAAGDFGSITVDTGMGQVVPAVDAEALTAMFHAEMNAGQHTHVQGEPRAATDDNGKIVNSGTPTALVSPTAAVQPILWAPPGCKISKLIAQAESSLQLKWTGANTGGVVLSGRILAQSQAVMEAITAQALGSLKFGGAKIRTIEKGAYKGPRVAFMPVKVKVG